MLVFFPYAFSGICSAELTDLRAAQDELRGIRVAAISVDTMFALRTFAEQLGLDFDLLSDFWPHGRVAEAYGVFDHERGCALRGTFVLDADGNVRWSVRHELGQRRDMAEAVRIVNSLR
jgi:peroxiredoxin